MAKGTKKIVLFIVEGPTDEDAFSGVMKKLYVEQRAVFHVVHGDITADRSVTPANAVKSVNKHVLDEMKRYGWRRTDLLKIIHLADTDGCYIPEDAIQYDSPAGLTYGMDSIHAPKGSMVARRNREKASVMDKLNSIGSIAGTPYSLYYLSRNLEHVLFNDASDLTNEQKMDYADDFADQYSDAPDDFVKFMSQSEFAVPGDYHDTWRYIAEGTNSLHRHSNCTLQLGEQNVMMTA